MADYVAEKGGRFSDIVTGYALTWLEIYTHPNNDDFRKKRPDPDQIHPGDTFWVPDNLVTLTDLESDLLDDVNEPDEHIDPLLLIDNKNLQKHKLKSGQTLASIAEEIGCEWQEIAFLNWGTEDDSEINWYLENFVGCESPNGFKTEFTGLEYPGLIWLPKTLAPKTSIRTAGVRIARRRAE